MAAKNVQRHAGAVGAVIAFLLVCGFHIPSAQAANKITIDGVMRGTTLETSRTIQAATEAYYLMFDGPCYGASVDTGVDDDTGVEFVISAYVSAVELCNRAVYTDGTWKRIELCASNPPPRSPYCSYDGNILTEGTWDVVCEQDSDCDDGVFCNGIESCAETACVAGSPPCSEAQVCDEASDRCVECMSSSDCDAGHFCLDGECRFAGLVKDTGDPNERVCNPPSYTDLGNGIVRDNVTGLEWQQATSPVMYSFFDVIRYLDSFGLDLKVPSAKYLMTILDSSSCNPSIDTTYFPDTRNDSYWTSNVFKGNYNISFAEGIDFATGAFDFWELPDAEYYVRGVRGQLPVSSFVDNGDGTVTDTRTGLMWQQTESYSGTFEQAEQYCSGLDFAGYSDWRMPTKNELYTLISYQFCDPTDYYSTVPCIDISFFPDSFRYQWSSTTCPCNSSQAWRLDFWHSASMYCDGKNHENTVRAVRGGPCRADGDWCIDENDCSVGSECVDGECVPVVVDDPPALTSGPFLAAGTWPLLPTSQESPMYLDANYGVLWKFSDDFASCSGQCTHAAEYQAVGGSEWTALDVTANADKGFAYVTLPIESLQNATTYSFRYSVTDCAAQTTESQTYYFRVAVKDAPPVIGSGPFLAAGAWPVLPTSASKAFVLDQNYNVLWTFSDDYAFCSGLCTHRARYRLVGDTVWTWLTVSADPTGRKYAYAELPVEGLAAGTYQFYFDVRDCEGQRTYAAKVYYFKVE